MEIVGRPEAIICARCNASVAVKSKGPVPSYCADCRRSGSRRRRSRPAVVPCERCGTDVPVKDRGPLPRFCRDGCQTPAADSPGPVREAADTPGAPSKAQRPWDRAPSRRSNKERKPPSPRPAARLSERISPTATRIDTANPAVGTADLSRAVRAVRLRHAVAIIGWIALVLVIALVVFVGSRPAPTGF